MKKVLLAAVAASLLASCGTPTSFVSTWKDPEAKPLAFTKILVVAFVPNEGQRRSAEDQMVANIKKAEAIASYRILSKERMKDADASKAAIEKLNVDGIITMRWLGKEDKLEYVPGTSYYGPSYYQPFWGYYGYATPMMYDPGYYTESQIITLETQIFSFPDEKLIWTGHSQTTDPTSLNDLIDSVALATSKQLIQEGLLQ
ncbi:MAG: hypothetical protein OEX18_08085 [Candidatus Krumholzibacteria bacterium]|nr:hypothetical protein [Candidatus Krumholzibacteria bacterium]MDH4337223.1 hypothetical protein [Candidatus Krumholzibacteria bacterium]MDH5268685.1 hypothetical protein [Candidatus Krumholzibacteria bacterium]